jgi:cold shock CspA family protein
MRGEMLWFNEKKNHGFILTDEDERLAVAGAGFAQGERPSGRCANRAVTFEVSESNGTRQAMNVVFERDPVARRARLRGGSRVRT